MSSQVDFARENGYVETVLNRRRYLKDINSRNAVVRGAAERNAVNAPIQGSAADIIKIAMFNLHKIFEEGNYRSKMILQVHDELVLEVAPGERDRLEEIVRNQMGKAYPLKAPLSVNIGVGKSWDLAAH